ncbi:hypothetical protein [Pedobacter sp. JCM 36344]
MPSKRAATNIRFYGEEELKMLLNLIVLNENGYKMTKIAKGES